MRPTWTDRWRAVPHRWWIASGATVVIISLLVWAFWPNPPERNWPRYLEFTVCQLTDEHGTTGTEAKPVWDGISEAARTTTARAQYLAVAGPQTADNAKAFLNSLALGRCSMIFAAGQPSTGAVIANADKFPNVQFYLVGAKAPQANVTTIDAGTAEEVRAKVTAIVTTAAQGQL